ncbi:hypothetical protein CLV62_14913 [Dysgonomonas alginatilytica]|uniref:Uncharacterized protein n=1 Tax=Dysgonomonas alginatilytica TaxID=1605892 RepID=A0A2V3PHN1_9BACT|nr:hypothetical protein [Dysgonomonas alginatilytica]PXV58404.1 hypothetical protein CLV62_14913 [Dysgonomonas alginatilytica]
MKIRNSTFKKMDTVTFYTVSMLLIAFFCWIIGDSKVSNLIMIDPGITTTMDYNLETGHTTYNLKQYNYE